MNGQATLFEKSDYHLKTFTYSRLPTKIGKG